MKVTIVYDNTVFAEGLKADWGFSCLVEAHGKTILFDAGANGIILFSNIQRLNIDPDSVDTIFLSHAHFDHTGGLSTFLNANSKVTVYAPITYRGIKKAREVEYYEDPQEICDGIYTTGMLQDIEQSLVVKTEKGLVVVVGCSHPGVATILESAKQFGDPYAIIGGLHDFRDFEILNDLSYVCPTHCTRYLTKIERLFPDKYIEGGAGKVIEI